MNLRRRIQVLVFVLLVCAAVLPGGAAVASTKGCTGQTASTVASATVPFGATIVAPTAKSVENFGHDVIVPEATAPHDDCP